MTEIMAPAEPSDEQIEDAVAFINQRANEAQRNLLEIGRYVLDNFFGGSLEEAVSKNPTKDVSFQRLADHPALLINRTTLSRAVGLYIQQQQILAVDRGHAALLDRVSPTHQQAILPVKELDTKVRLLRETVKQGLSTRGLRKVVEAERRKVKSSRGRKPLTAVQKVWRRCYQAISKRSAFFPEDREEFISRYHGAVSESTKRAWLEEIEEALGYLRVLHETVSSLDPVPDRK